MNMQRIFHTPEGVRDIYGEECSRKKRLQKELHQVFSRYGYEDIETPGFEYFEVFSNEVGTIPSKDLYKFLFLFCVFLIFHHKSVKEELCLS